MVKYLAQGSIINSLREYDSYYMTVFEVDEKVGLSIRSFFALFLYFFLFSLIFFLLYFNKHLKNPGHKNNS